MAVAVIFAEVYIACLNINIEIIEDYILKTKPHLIHFFSLKLALHESKQTFD
jgi:hypothetical protein